MEDPNSIAWLTPAESRSVRKYSWQAILNSLPKDIVAAPEPPFKVEAKHPLEDEDDNIPENAAYPYLHLSFNPGPKEEMGFVFGWDPECDIVLPRRRHISRRHCVLKFDNRRQLILQGTSSTGTIVEYVGHERGEKLCKKSWVLSGDLTPSESKKRILIKIHEDIMFQILVTSHDQCPEVYNRNVDLLGM